MSIVLIYLVMVNVVCFAVFAIDTRRARDGGRRIPERVLLRLAMMGGSPGALFAQQWLRHKTRKEPFRSRLLMIVAFQAIAIAVLVIASVAGFGAAFPIMPISF